MSISGGIKFFTLGSARTGLATAAASTGNTSAGAVLDGNIYTRWLSVGSDDVTAETLTITFLAAVTIDRLLLANLNWKDFDIKYDNGSGYTHFAGVTGLDGAKANITETAFADSSAYYEVTPVTGVTSIRCTVTKTQAANAQKYLYRLFAFEEIGTFAGFPKVSKVIHSRNERSKRTASGKMKVQKSFRTSQYALNFTTYPTDTEFRADVDLVEELFDLDTPFNMWLCGGRRGEDYFRHTPLGWKLEDLLTMSIVGSWDPSFRDSIYVSGINASLTFVESVP